MKATAVLAAILASVSIGAARAAEVEQVIVRQQWPWSTDVKVEYRLSGVSAAAPVDIGVEVLNGETPMQSPNLAAAIKGDRYGITKSIGELTIDPVKAFGTNNVAIDSFRVRLSLSPSPDNLDEALYKIFELSSGACTDVTRKDLLNGKWGTYETDYSRIDPNFTTELDDVLIWTGVTNDIAYKTSHLVMRKIHAANKVWRAGDPEGTVKGNAALKAQCYVTLTYDYYIAVFETTVAQNARFGNTQSVNVSALPKGAAMLHECFAHPLDATYKSPFSGEQVVFPTNSYLRDVGALSTAAYMWQRTKNYGHIYEFTLPTRAEWEFACHGGNAGVLYSGEAQTQDNVNKLAWNASNSGNESHEVGLKAPNAYGLYDMLGNLEERVCAVGEYSAAGVTGSGTAQDPYVNPLCNLNPAYTGGGSSVKPWVMGGGSFSSDDGNWRDCRPEPSAGWVEWYGPAPRTGYRFVMPARADGQWADHPGQQ